MLGIETPTGDNKKREVALRPLGLTTREARRVWATRKSETLAARRMEISLGAPKTAETPIEKGIAEYFEVNTSRLRPRTLSTYAEAIEKFRTWLSNNSVYRARRQLQLPTGKAIVAELSAIDLIPQYLRAHFYRCDPKGHPSKKLCLALLC